MIPPRGQCKAYLIYSLIRCEFDVAFAWIVKKLVFLVQILWIQDWSLWKDFYKRVHLLFKEQHVSDCQKIIFFVQIMHLKFTFLTSDDIKSYY